MQDIITDKRIEKIGLVIGTIFFAVALIKPTFTLKVANQKKEKIPPLVPYKIPFLGSTADYYKDPPLFTKINTEKYGSIFRMHFHGELVTVVGAEDAPEVFHHPDLSFPTSQFKYIGNNFFQGINTYILPESAISDIIMKHLTPNLKDYSPRAFELFLQEADHIKESEFTLPDLLPFIRKFVSKYSASAFVGLELCNNEDLLYAFEQSVKDIGDEMRPGILRVVSPLVNKLYMRYMSPKTEVVQKYRKLIRGTIEKEIYKRKLEAKKNNYDVLDYILNTYPHEIDNDYLESITTVILVFIFVGVHTTAGAVTYVFYCLLKYPEYIQALREEQNEALEAEGIADTDKVLYTPGVYRRLVKLDSFIHEAMRTRMVGIGLAHTNISNQDIVLKSGAIVKPGKEVFVNMWHVHHDPENQKGLIHPEKFDGFRFVGLNKLVTKASIDNISFGMGKHACPGRWFATHQIKGIVSYFIRNYDMTAVGEINVMGAESEHTGPPSGQVKFVKRKHAKASS